MKIIALGPDRLLLGVGSRSPSWGVNIYPEKKPLTQQGKDFGEAMWSSPKTQAESSRAEGLGLPLLTLEVTCGHLCSVLPFPL